MTALLPIFLPFRDALIAGVRRGQRLSCSFATLERIRAADVVVSGGTGERCYRYSNIVTGQCVESPMLDRLVEQWIEDLDKSARFSTALGGAAGAAGDQREGGR